MVAPATSIDDTIDAVRTRASGAVLSVGRQGDGPAPAEAPHHQRARSRAGHRVAALARRYPAQVPQRAPLTYGAAAIDASTARLLDSLGGRGGGLPRIEDNPQLHPYQARGLGDDHGVYHEMSRGDGAVAGTLAIIYREIRRAHYRVVVPDDATDDERAAGELVERALGLGRWDSTGGWLRGGFRGLLAHGLLATVYGFSPCELSWDTRPWQGRSVLVPTRADWRAPWSVERWIWRGDDLVAMTQRVQDRNRPRFALGQRVEIPVDRLLLFVHQYVDGNPEGTSMLRPAWLPWRAKKDTILRRQVAEDKLFGGVAILKQGGTPEMGPYPWCSDVDDEGFGEVFGLWRDDALDWLQLPYGYEVDLAHPEFQIPDRTAELRWYDHQIFITGLAALLGLDAAGAASRGLSDSMAAILYNALHSHAIDLCDTINGIEGHAWTGLVRGICQANFAVTETFRPPRVMPAGIQHQDLGAYVDAISKAYQFRMATPSIEDQLEFRRMAGLPELSRDRLEQLDALLSGRHGDASQISQRDTQAPVEPPSEGEGAGGSSRPEGSDVGSGDSGNDAADDEAFSARHDATISALLADPDPSVRLRAADVWLRAQQESRR